MHLDSVRELKARLVPAAAQAAREGAGAVALGAHPAPGGGYRLAVRVQDRAALAGPRVREIEAAARGEVDVRHVGRIVAREAAFLRARHRPLLIGSSVAHVGVTAGTIGAFVRRAGDPRVHVLSNNHVLTAENRAAVGDAVLQPGPADGGREPADAIGALAAFVPLREGAANAVDAALAVVAEGVEVDPRSLTGVGERAPGEGVPEEAGGVGKLGRTTGRTSGRVTAFELDDVRVAYGTGVLRFDDQIEIEGTGAGPFSAGGDSGSLVWEDGSLRAVGLLFAGGEQGAVDVTYANPIRRVLDALAAELL